MNAPRLDLRFASGGRHGIDRVPLDDVPKRRRAGGPEGAENAMGTTDGGPRAHDDATWHVAAAGGRPAVAHDRLAAFASGARWHRRLTGP